jgi:hypothetical protein
MQTLSDIEQEAMRLPDSSRAYPASRLLDSLPAVLSDDDDGLAEAMRRDAEMDWDPAAVMTLEELKRRVRS